MRAVHLCLGLLLLTSLAFSQSQRSGDPVAHGRPAVHNRLYDLEHQFGQALQRKDAGFLSAHTASDFIDVAWNGLVFDKSKLLSDLAYLAISRYEMSNMKFRPLGADAGLVTYDLKIDASAAGKDAPRHQYASSVWVKREGTWMLQMHQVTPADH